MSLLTDLISWWSMDDDPDNGAEFDSRNRTVLSTRFLTQINGRVEKAVRFASDGSSMLYAPSNGLLQLENRPFTIAFWFKLNAITGSHVFVSKASTSPIDAEYRIEYDAFTTAIAFRVGSVSLSNVVLAFNSIAPPLNVWHFIVAWLDKADGFLHIRMDNSNYEAISLNPQVGGMDVNTDQFTVGMNPDGSNFLNGAMDELAIWGRVLTRNEQEMLWNGGAGTGFCALVDHNCKAVACCDEQNFAFNSSEATDADHPFCQPGPTRRRPAEVAGGPRAILEELGQTGGGAIMEEGEGGAILEE